MLQPQTFSSATKLEELEVWLGLSTATYEFISVGVSRRGDSFVAEELHGRNALHILLFNRCFVFLLVKLLPDKCTHPSTYLPVHTDAYRQTDTEIHKFTNAYTRTLQSCGVRIFPPMPLRYNTQHKKGTDHERLTHTGTSRQLHMYTHTLHIQMMYVWYCMRTSVFFCHLCLASSCASAASGPILPSSHQTLRPYLAGHKASHCCCCHDNQTSLWRCMNMYVTQN